MKPLLRRLADTGITIAISADKRGNVGVSLQSADGRYQPIEVPNGVDRDLTDGLLLCIDRFHQEVLDEIARN